MTTPSFANREGKFWFDGGMDDWQPQLNTYAIGKSHLVKPRCSSGTLTVDRIAACSHYSSSTEPLRLSHFKQVRDNLNQLPQWLHRVD